MVVREVIPVLGNLKESLIMWFYQGQIFETNKSIEKIWELLESNKDSINQELRKSFFSRLGGFRVKLNRMKNQLRICRLNPLWYYTVLKITPATKGCVLEIKSVPQPVYDYIFLGLLTVLFTVLAYSIKEILFLLIVYLGFLSIGIINLITKYRNFYILTTFCMDVLAHKK